MYVTYGGFDLFLLFIGKTRDCQICVLPCLLLHLTVPAPQICMSLFRDLLRHQLYHPFLEGQTGLWTGVQTVTCGMVKELGRLGIPWLAIHIKVHVHVCCFTLLQPVDSETSFCQYFNQSVLGLALMKTNMDWLKRCK